MEIELLKFFLLMHHKSHLATGLSSQQILSLPQYIPTWDTNIILLLYYVKVRVFETSDLGVWVMTGGGGEYSVFCILSPPNVIVMAAAASTTY